MTKIIKYDRLFVVLLGLFLCFFYGCANQLPPGGGEEDKTPPKALVLKPKPNSVKYRGNSIDIRFDKYVDRRSLQDAFKMSPPYKGDIDYNWSGKEVELVFSKPFYKTDTNKTFVVNIGQDLKDIHGNSLTEPIRFAFSTGSQIDMGEITGRVYNSNNKLISIFAYKVSSELPEFDPTKNTSDYFTESSQSGTYDLTNLSPGTYRIIAIDDEDKNLLYTSERESFGVLPRDIKLLDSMKVTNVNFLIKTVSAATENPADSTIKDYFKDTLNIVYSSIENGAVNVLPDQSIFLFFERYKPAREAFVNAFTMKDQNDKLLKVVFNWHNDSLVEVFAPNKFEYNVSYQIVFNLSTVKDSVYHYSLKFKTASINSFGELKGVIRRPTSDSNSTAIDSTPVYINLQSVKVKPIINYTYQTTDTLFDIKNLLDGDYNMFSFMDENRSGIFNYGNPFPFSYSEPFYFYPDTVNIKGGWAVENLIINFNK